MPRPIHAAKRFCLLVSHSIPCRTRSDDSAVPSVSGGTKRPVRLFCRGMTYSSSFMFERTRFLLGATVDGTETVDHGRGVDTHDAARRETLPDDVERALVIAVVKNRHDNGVVADVKIRVAGRESRVRTADIPGHGKRNDINVEGF